MSDPEIDLAFIGRALQRMTNEVGTLRDDMAVLTAIVMRLDANFSRQDATLTALLTEIRAMHAQYSRLANRVSQLESEGPVRP
jgi:ubiquinone biosynthesis protein UbiJ